MIVTRFAPSPTGYLHLGHAASAFYAAQAGQRFLLRIEDIDPTRCRPAFTEAIFEDLAWLGLSWETPVRKQSEHFEDYARALDALRQKGLLYPCFCTRKEIQVAVSAPHEGESFLYPGTCKALSADDRQRAMDAGKPFAWRLDVGKAMDLCGPLTWNDKRRGEILARPDLFGDVVLARKECPASYHLCVTYDDARQGVTLVTRGEDLFDSTHVHRLLQALLGLPTPLYDHHPLLRDASGRRLAKRDMAQTLRSMREGGVTADEVRAKIGDL